MEPCGMGQSITALRPSLLRGIFFWQRGHLGPERLTKSRLIYAPISSNLIPVTTYPLKGAKALIFRTFTPVQGHPDKGMSPQKWTEIVMRWRRRAQLNSFGKGRYGWPVIISETFFRRITTRRANAAAAKSCSIREARATLKKERHP